MPDKNNKNSHGLTYSPMRRWLSKFEVDLTDRCTWPMVCALTAVMTASVSLAQSGINTTPEIRAREIAALAPPSDKQELRKEEVKDMSVVMSGVEKILRSNIEKLLDIWQFHEKEIPSVARMRFMHRQAPDQIAAALRPYGYYRSTVEARLSDLGSKWQAVYRIKPGDRVAVKTASLKITGAGADDPEFKQLQQFAEENIRSGVELDQQTYGGIKQSILNTAAQLGYFESEFLANEIVVDLDSYTANVTLHFQTGERYRLGKLTMTQDVKWLSEELLAKYVELEEQEYFNASRVQEVQSDLSNTSYYRNVEVRASADDAVDRVIPVSVDLTHMNPKQYVYGVGYGTDTGARIRFGVTRRRLNKSGHHYQAQVNLSEIGYGLGVGYTIPTRDPRTDSYGFEFNIEEEDSVRKFRNIGIGGNYRYRDGLWFKTYSLNYQLEEDIEDESTSALLIPSLEWVRTSPAELEKRINVTRGNWLQLELRGASSDLLSDTSFIQAKVSAKKIISYGNGNRLIARASAGTTRVTDYSKLPSSLRFYTGGDRTLRGYSYNVVAPVDADNQVQGGKHLAEVSLEYEVPFRPNFSWAVFSDLGDAFDDKPNLRNGIGLGLRWRSPIGPVRIDAGRRLDDPSKGNWHLHLGIGPDL